MSDKRTEGIAGLRELADYLEARPEVPTPFFYGRCFNVFANADSLPQIARAMGSVDKNIDGDDFELRRKFRGGIVLVVNFPREEVCERRVVGTELVPELVIPAHDVPELVIAAHVREVVEWECPPSVLAMAVDEEGRD